VGTTRVNAGAFEEGVLTGRPAATLRAKRRALVWIIVALAYLAGHRLVAATGGEMFVLDDRQSATLNTRLGSPWRLVTDAVMGGVSAGRLTIDEVEGRSCIRLQGDVRLDNSGGFLQVVLDLKRQPGMELSRYAGLLLEAYGNGESYNVHLRTAAVTSPWQSYRASFQAPAEWQTFRLPFSRFQPHRIAVPLDITQLQRTGIVAIGRAFSANLCVGKLALYEASS